MKLKTEERMKILRRNVLTNHNKRNDIAFIMPISSQLNLYHRRYKYIHAFAVFGVFHSHKYVVFGGFLVLFSRFIHDLADVYDFN